MRLLLHGSACRKASENILASRDNSVENVPPGRFQEKLASNRNKGKRSCSPPTAPSPLSASLTFPRTAGNHPEKCCRIFPPLSPYAGSTAQGISLSARTPAEMRSADSPKDGEPAESDQGRCPWTLAAFSRNCCTNGAVPFVPSGHFPTPWGITKKLLYLPKLMRSFFDRLSHATLVAWLFCCSEYRFTRNRIQKRRRTVHLTPAAVFLRIYFLWESPFPAAAHIAAESRPTVPPRILPSTNQIIQLRLLDSYTNFKTS